MAVIWGRKQRLAVHFVASHWPMLIATHFVCIALMCGFGLLPLSHHIAPGEYQDQRNVGFAETAFQISSNSSLHLHPFSLRGYARDMYGADLADHTRQLVLHAEHGLSNRLRAMLWGKALADATHRR
jgi:hypothetical protein